MIDSVFPVYRLLEAVGFTDPIHPAAAHLPIGLIAGAFFLGVTSLFFRGPTAGRAAHYCAIAAFLSLFLTAPLGYLDWHHFFAAGFLRPVIIKLVLAGVFIVLLAWAVVVGRRQEQTPGLLLCVYGVSLLSALGLGYFGGSLVYAERTPRAPLQFRPGETLFRGNCSGCHPYGANIVDPTHPVRNAPEMQEFASFMRWIRDPRLPNGSRGVMPPFLPARVGDSQARALYDYVSTTMGTPPPEKKASPPAPSVIVRTDAASIAKGQDLFETTCTGCHTADSTEHRIGPGLKSLLKQQHLPVSGRPATAENVYRQLRQPYQRMPSFATRLSDEDVFDLIAYLNTR
jgi:mono/diheme cytochrome c family protein